MQGFIIKLKHPCKSSSWTEVILVCPWCGSLTEAEPLVLALPHTAQNKILCDRGQDETPGPSPANLDWLRGFCCFGRGDEESAHPSKSVEQWLRLLVSGCKCDLIYGRPEANLTTGGL